MRYLIVALNALILIVVVSLLLGEYKFSRLPGEEQALYIIGVITPLLSGIVILLDSKSSNSLMMMIIKRKKLEEKFKIEELQKRDS